MLPALCCTVSVTVRAPKSWCARALTAQAQDGGLAREDALGLVAERADLLRAQEEGAVLARLPLPRHQQLPQHRLRSAATLPLHSRDLHGRHCHSTRSTQRQLWRGTSLKA